MGFSTEFFFCDGSWHESPCDREPWLAVTVFDSDVAAIRFQPAPNATGNLFLGIEPRLYFDDPDLHAPIDVARESEAFASWAAAAAGEAPAPEAIAGLMTTAESGERRALLVEDELQQLLSLCGIPLSTELTDQAASEDPAASTFTPDDPEPTVDRKSVTAALRSAISEHLRPIGFVGSFPHLRRILDDRFELIHVQFSGTDDTFAVNVACAPPEGITDASGRQIEPKDLKASDASHLAHGRVGAPWFPNGDHWFRYGAGLRTSTDGEAWLPPGPLAEHVVQLIVDQALPFLASKPFIIRPDTAESIEGDLLEVEAELERSTNIESIGPSLSSALWLLAKPLAESAPSYGRLRNRAVSMLHELAVDRPDWSDWAVLQSENLGEYSLRLGLILEEPQWDWQTDPPRLVKAGRVTDTQATDRDAVASE